MADMARDGGLTVLRRMTGGRPDRPRTGVVSLVRTLRLSLAKAGHEALRVRLQCGDVTETPVVAAEIADHLPGGALIVFLQGRAGACGVAALDAPLLASVLEARTTGAVGPGPVTERVPTQTDAILARGFLDATLTEIAGRLEEHPGWDWLCGYHPRDRVPEAHRLPYLLPDLPYAAIRAEVDIAAGVRRGALTLVLPQAAASRALPRPAPVTGPRDAAEQPGSDGAAWRAAMRLRLGESPAGLDAVLCRLTLPLSEVEALVPGSVLTFPRATLGRVALLAADGSEAGRARLGQSEGKRAIRIDVQTPLPAAASGDTAPALPAMQPQDAAPRAAG